MDVGLSRIVVRVYGLGLFQSYKSYRMHSHVICIRVDAAAKGAVYEVIAGPQEQRGQVQQENFEHPPKAQLSPVSSSSPKASPGVHPIILNYDNYICLYYLCIRFRNCLEP